MFSPVNKDLLSEISELKVISATKTKENEWLCHTEDLFILVKYKDGILQISRSDREYDINNELFMIGVSTDKEQEINFNSIKLFFNWDTPDSQIWDE